MVRTLWSMVIDRWNASTCQVLDPSDLRLTLLGDRGEQEDAVSAGLWRMTHAATAWTIHKAAKAAAENAAKADSASSMLVKVRQMLQRMLTAAWAGKRESSQGEWAAWKAEQWVVTRKGGATAHILEGKEDSAVQQARMQSARGETKAEGHVYTDGSWTPADEAQIGPPAEAGYGVATLRTVEPADVGTTSELFIPLSQITFSGLDGKGNGKLVDAIAGKVQTDPTGPRYMGAAAHTNNTGELTGMRVALQAAGKRGRGAGGEVIHSDSLYAINMTTGKWMPKSRGTGRRNASMIAEMRREWRAVQRKRPGEVTIRHVRSHIKVPGNEIADFLADAGASELLLPGQIMDATLQEAAA